MEQKNTNGSGIAWRRGLHRLFILFCVLWAVFILIGIPIKKAQQSFELAVRLNIENSATTQAEKDKHEQRQKALMDKASLPHVYKIQVLPEIHWYLLGVLFPPALLYFLVWSMHRLGRWLYRGFRAP